MRTIPERLAVMAALAALLGGCGDNRTFPQHGGYETPGIEPLACVPNLDGRIDATELSAAIGVPIRYLVSPAGEERTVDVAGAVDAGGTLRWDWSLDHADDAEVVVTPASLAGKWYESAFGVSDGFVTPFDAGGRLESVYRQDGEALWLLGLASRAESPAEGQTLMVYQAPVALLRFPVAPGQSFVSTGTIANGVVSGLPYAGKDVYEVTVDALGRMELPQLVFEQAHRVRTRVTVEPAVGAATARRQVSYFFECFAEVARAVSRADEPEADFTTAAEQWRLGLR
jgi:hypothetical protein